MEKLLLKLEENGVEIEDVLERLMGDEQLYLDYLEKFLDNDCVNKLTNAINEKRYEDASREVHTLKGVALNLGLLPLADVCMDMLMEFRDGNNEEAVNLLPQVQSVFNEWITIIKNVEK